MRSLRLRMTRELSTPTRVGLLLAAGLLVLSDWGSYLAGDSVLPGGPLDECAHLVTMLLVAWALGPVITRGVLIPALLASVAMDVDHVPQHLGTQFLTAGTPRPYPHSLLTLAVVAGCAWAWPRRRELWLGVALGLAVHLWRDVSEPGPGVSLLWPITRRSWSVPHWSYLLAMAAVVAVVAVRPATTRLLVRHASRQTARS